MSRIILDFGSGNTSKNDSNYVKEMIDRLAGVDSYKHEIIIKWQLFTKAGGNIPLDHDVFRYAYSYANKYGYKTTASVFDLESLKFLLEFDIPFVKIANNRKLDWLIGEIPRKIPVYQSVSDDSYNGIVNGEIMYCVSKYPAKLEDYEKAFPKYINFAKKDEHSGIDIEEGYELLSTAISDHTIGLDLFNKYKPEIWEKHYKLKDSTGLDAGEFAITPEELKEIL